jgi:uncharacterized protein YbaR (Trm112 family)
VGERDLLREAREAYARGENVMALFRSEAGAHANTHEAVLVSYDLQSGSYRAALDDPASRARVDRYSTMIADVLGELEHDSLLEAGTGEATTLLPVLSKLPHPPRRVVAFDLAWSRVAHARAHAAGFGTAPPELFAGDMFALPVVDGAFDVVLTAHALEPNGGRERAGIAELARASRRWLVLFEPSYELGGPQTRANIEKHGYVRGLRQTAEDLGLEVVRHELTDELTPNNETALLVLRKPGEEPEREHWLGCPRCGEPLREVRDHLFCPSEGLVYPVLDGIPCLDPRNAIVASAFADEL